MGVHVVITREQAIAQGVAHYFTGKSCRHGHVAPRYVVGGDCRECTRRRNGVKLGTERSSIYGLGSEIEEPLAWENDGGVRREPVLDHNFSPPRVVRRVGWRRCMCCPIVFFSPDVARVRICDSCKNKTNFD